jgi:TatD DNase family protein
MYTDSHCHLDKLDLQAYDGSLASLIESANQAGVERMLCVGIDLENLETVCQLADRFASVYASVGIHPLACKDQLVVRDELIRFASREKVIAIGETGLDYHYSPENQEIQKTSFATHLEVAKELVLPIIVHTRAARKDTIDLIRTHASQDVGGVLHCFTEDWLMAKEALECNFYISFSGIVSFRNASALREVVKQVPDDRLLIETDAPYLAPVPHRGKSNEPRFLPAIAECVAQLRGISPEELARQTSLNFNRLFNLQD